MVDIKTEKGLDIPIMGKPQGAPQPLKALQNAFFEGHRLKIALSLLKRSGSNYLCEWTILSSWANHY